MAEETKPLPIEPPPSLNWAIPMQKITRYKERMLSFAGKNGMNPYIWLREKGIDKLEVACADTKQQTKDLYNQVMKLDEKDEPRIDLLDPALLVPEVRVLPKEKKKE